LSTLQHTVLFGGHLRESRSENKLTWLIISYLKQHTIILIIPRAFVAEGLLSVPIAEVKSWRPHV